MSQLYPAAKQAFMSGSLNWVSDPVVAILINTELYVYSGAHRSLLDLPVEARIAASGTLANRSCSNGIADADDISFGPVTGQTAGAVIVATDTGIEATSQLICYLNSAGTTLPVTPNGSSVIVRWSNGSSRIFSL